MTTREDRGREVVPVTATMAMVLAVAAAAVTPPAVSAQEGYTDLPLGLSLSRIMVESGLPLDPADPDGWTSQKGGGRAGPGALPVHYSALEVSSRFPGVAVDSVRAALEATLRSELEARGGGIVERPGRPGVRPPPGEATGDAWTFSWRAPDRNASGWVTLLVLPDEGDRFRILVTSMEVREGGG